MNCIGAEAADLVRGQWVTKRDSRVEGIGGVATAKGTVRVRFVLPTTDPVEQEFVVIEELQTAIILGLPFLREVRAVVDCANGWLDTKFGRIELVASLAIGGAHHVTDEEFVGALGAVDHEGDRPDAESALKNRMKDTNLNAEELEAVKNLMLEFRDLWESERRGATTHTQHDILLDTARPIFTRPRRFTDEQQKVIIEETRAMLDAGVIEESTSPYASDVVLVRKPTGAWRFCIDFRRINDRTIKDKYPLPPIQDLIRAIRESRYFVALDLRSGYWQILLADTAKPVTAFRTPRGLFQFRVMPFGLTNAPATFQRMMDEILGDMYWRGILVYLDDVLVHAKTFGEALNNLRVVLERLRAADLTLNLDKCDFFPRAIKYLGYIVEEGAIRPNPKKIEALRNAKIPTNVSEVRSLLGLAGFYRQFIPHYSAKAEPLTRLTKKDIPFAWTDEQTRAVAALLEGLEEQVLANPEVEERFKLETDASDTGIGAVLSCSKDGVHWRPVEFMSKKLSEVQQRWPVHEREAWAIIAALEKFDCYLRGRQFDVFTDNSSLQWMKQASRGKIARWAARLAEYDMTIYHVSGTRMAHVDFLSRYVNEPEEGLAERMTVWMGATAEDDGVPTLEEVKEAQRQQPPLWTKGFAARDGVVFYRGKMYVPPALRNRVLHACHTLNPVVHPGMRKTKATACRVFRWPGMDKDITDYVRSCLTCQRVRPGIERLQGMLQRHDVQGAFEKIYMDVWSVEYRGVKHKCLTMIDSLTRWVEVSEIKNETAEEIARAAFREWVSRFGVPAVLVTDRGPAFTSDVFRQWCKTLGVRHVRTTPRHPEGNAPIESFHRNLNRAIARHTVTGLLTLGFEELISLTLMGYRATLHTQLDDSPSFLAHGVDMRPAVQQDWRFIQRVGERQRVRNLMCTRLDVMARCHERGQQIVRASRYSNRAVGLGDLVLLRLHPDEAPALAFHDSSRKVRPTWSLPHRVVKVADSGQSATVRNLVTFGTRQVLLRDAHIHDLRVISPPRDDSQRQQWEEAIAAERFQDVHDPAVRTEWFDRFWRTIEEPQVEDRKRARRADYVTAAGELEVL